MLSLCAFAELMPVLSDLPGLRINVVNGNTTLCHHVIHDGHSVCVVVMDGVQYYMPPDVSADYEGAVGDTPGPAVATALACPAALPLPCKEAPGERKVVCRATSSHLVLGCHALALAAGQCALKNDFSQFRQQALANASSVTPVGAHFIFNICTPRATGYPEADGAPHAPLVRPVDGDIVF